MIEPYEVSIDNKIQSMEDKINKLEKENIKLNNKLLGLENIVGILSFVDIFLICLQYLANL